jgi:tRNA(adenine34) deaminase
MQQALLQAQQAFEEEEVPIGAVIAVGGRIIARGYNMVERLGDATAHAEMITITSAMDYLGGKYLDEATLYVTIEPCGMCAGALRWAQLERLVYGAREEKCGFSQFQPRLLHPRTQVQAGVMAEECSELMRSFFKSKRP